MAQSQEQLAAIVSGVNSKLEQTRTPLAELMALCSTEFPHSMRVPVMEGLGHVVRDLDLAL